MIVAVAIVQAGILRGPKSMSVLWVVAYLLGSMVIVVLAVLSWGIGFGLGKSLIPFLEQQGELGLEIISTRDILLLASVYLIAPLWATIALGLPTGLILSRYRLRNDFGESSADSQLSMG